MSPWTTLQSIWKHPANRGHRLSASARYFWWQLAKRTVLHHYDLEFHGLKLRCHRDSHSASAALYFSGLPDYREMQFMRRYLRPGDCFVDVGANVGVYTLLAASIVGARGTVHAFEPAPATFQRLCENTALNKLSVVHLHQIAVSDSAGNVEMTDPGDDALVRISTGLSEEQGSRIECVKLEDFLPATSMAMLKIDVEGAEPLVLRGARKHLAAGNPPVIQIELDGYSMHYGTTTHDFIDEIESWGYDIAVYDPEASLLIYTRTPWKFGVLNALAIHRASRDAVQARLVDREALV